MIPVYNLSLPKYKTGNINKSKTDTASHYGLEDIPVTYIENSPDFDITAHCLRDFLRKKFIGDRLCIRGISIIEHNRVNGTSFINDDLIKIIINTGHDRYNPEVRGDRYDNFENRRIDIYAYDVIPFLDDNDLTYFFQSFYWFGLSENGEPIMIDIIIVYDSDLLDRVEHHYNGRSDIKRDGFTFRNSDKNACIKCIIKI
jgi:hypothetical protein